jgi:hypothetical protein
MLKTSLFKDTMLISSIKFCGANKSFAGIQVFLEDYGQGTRDLQLMPIGYTTQCEKVPIASDDFINEARIDYKGGEITMF